MAGARPTRESAPQVLGLLGHDVRWRLLQTLARSDRRVNELVESTGERQNLVSYHLGLLKTAHLVRERRSSADARDIYYSLDLDRLDSELMVSVASLHPALQHSATRPANTSRPGTRPRVLFICTGNSARSQIAEALLRRQARGAVEVHSAGLRPNRVHPLTLEVMSELGLPTRGLRSKGLDEFEGVEFDYVVSLCDVAREECPRRPERHQLIHWSLPDPAAVSGSDTARLKAFRLAAAELERRISQFVPVLLGGRRLDEQIA